MRFYSMGIAECRELPVRSFWALSNLIARVRAEEILDWLPAHASAMGGEGVQNFVTQLEERVGNPIVETDVKPDIFGINRLKNILAN